jgi:hypothetical protein
MGSEITALTTGVNKKIHHRDFLVSLGFPIGDPTPTFEDNQGTIHSIWASHTHNNTHHLATKISWLNEHYLAGIIKLLYTKAQLQLSDCNTKP